MSTIMLQEQIPSINGLDKNGKADDNEYQELLKLEFSKLHKEFRALENKRHGIAKDSASSIKITTRLLPILKKDELDLEYELQNATCRLHRRKVDYMAASMKSALKTFDLYQTEIKWKLKQIKEIERHVDRITEKILKQRIKMLASYGLQKTPAERDRDLLRAEDKLYHSNCAFNIQIHENKRLRDEIQDSLLERRGFFKMHNSIKRQIGAAKKKMLMIVQQAIQTYDNRDEAMSKVKALREREEKEVKQHGMEIQEFERTIHHDRTILDFIKTKLKPRPAFEDAADRRVRIGVKKEKELNVILRKYKRSFRIILSYSNTKSIPDLVDRYNALDEGNFEQFKYVTELNNECEFLIQMVEEVKESIQNMQAEIELREKHQREEQRNLQLAIINKEDELASLEFQMHENRDRLEKIIAAVAEAMRITDSASSPALRVLGNKNGVDANNARLCLTILDMVVTGMKWEQESIEEAKSNTNTAFKPVLPKSKPVKESHGGPFSPTIIMFHSHGDNADDEDAKVFEREPYYFDEMREYMFQKMIEDEVIEYREPAVPPLSSTKTATKKDNRKSLLEAHQEFREEQQAERARLSGKKEPGDDIAGPMPEIDEDYQPSIASEYEEEF